MREITLQNNKKIYIFENVLSKDICLKWVEEVDAMKQHIEENKRLADEVFQTVGEAIGGYPFSTKGPRVEVNLAKRGTGIHPHFDIIYGGEKWRVLCYLNEISNGGTDFQDGKEWFHINASMGTVLIFDISLYHRGALNQENKKKYTIGIRLLE